VTVFAAGFAEAFCGSGGVVAHPCTTSVIAKHDPIRTADVRLIEASWVSGLMSSQVEIGRFHDLQVG